MAIKRDMDIATLRSFKAIAETGSMTRAASRRNMTQSAISMQIKRLETNLGLQVFERTSKGMPENGSSGDCLNCRCSVCNPAVDEISVSDCTMGPFAATPGTPNTSDSATLASR